MPFVLVRVDPVEFKLRRADYTILKLFKQLPDIVAEALNTGSGTKGELKPTEIEVKVEEIGPFDITNKKIEITVWANDYAERRKNLNERRENIENKVKEILSTNQSGFVWILLATGSFGEW